MVTTVYLLRHAQYESPDNILPVRLPGFHLSEVGKVSAHKLAEFFTKHPIAAVFSSPLERTHETADIIAKPLRLTVVTDDRLLEVRSPVQGKPEGFPETMGGWKLYTSDWYKKRGGETPEEEFARMEAFMKEKISEYHGREIVVVSHGDPIMFLVGGYMGKKLLSEEVRSLDYIQMGMGLVLTFDSDGKFLTSRALVI